jgi:hypothetical protein
MESNTHSGSRADQLAALAAVVDGLVAQDLGGLGDAALAERVMALRGLVDRLEGHWLGELADLDARGGRRRRTRRPGRLHRFLAAGPAAHECWDRCQLGAHRRALHRGPLTGTAQALAEGVISPAHAQVLAHGTHDLPDHVAADAEPVLAEAARRLDPPRLRRVIAHLRLVADPDGAGDQAERRHQRRAVWLASTWEGMVAVNGLLDPEAGQTLVAALEPLASPVDSQDPRSGGQRRADALVELARRSLEAGRLPQSGGVRPQLLVTVDLDSLLAPGGLGGEIGGVGPLDPEACQRLACDGAVTRVLVTRQRPGHLSHPATTPAGRNERSQLPKGRQGWRPATPPTRRALRPATPPTTTRAPMAGWRRGCGPRRRCYPQPWGVRPPSRWRSAGPAGW